MITCFYYDFYRSKSFSHFLQSLGDWKGIEVHLNMRTWTCASIRVCMWIWEMVLVAAECALQAIHNRWWNLASRPALWSFPPPAAACFPRTHLCCWPRVVCACVSEGERNRLRMSLSLPTSAPRASFHSSICQTWIWKRATFSSLIHHVHIWPRSWWWMSKLSGKAKEQFQSDKAAQTINLSHSVATNTVISCSQPNVEVD